jgi:RNA polymerase sigma-70 factor, ECF subfamily
MDSGRASRNARFDVLDTGGSADAASLDELLPLVYEELRRIAHGQLDGEERRDGFETTDLVHETYLRLAGDERVVQQGRAYFYGAAARAMRQVLVDAARRRRAAKRGGGADLVTLDNDTVAVGAYADELLALDAALRELEIHNPRQARVVECRYFGGLGVDETAAALDVSPRTVKSDWALARAWLFDELRSP